MFFLQYQKTKTKKPSAAGKLRGGIGLLQPGEDLKITGDTQINAVWITSCTVSFDLGDKSLTPIDNMIVDYGAVKEAPSVPHRTGYVFSAWKIKNGGIFDFANPITQDLELEAVWTQIKTNLTVYFPKNVNDVETIKVDVGGVVKTFSYSEGEEEGEYKKFTGVVTGLDHGTYDISLTTLKGNNVVGDSYTDSVNMKYDITDKEVKVDTSNVVDITTSVQGTVQATTISGDATNGYVISGNATLSYGNEVTVLYSNDGNEPSLSYSSGTSITVTNKLRLKATPTDPTKWSKGSVNSTVSFNTIGATGPAGGTIFYDAGKVTSYPESGNASYSYRFLEVSTSDLEGKYTFNGWGAYHSTRSALGAGKANTELLKNSLSDYSGSATEACVKYSGGGYTDWFLPSLNEMKKLYEAKSVVSGISSAKYWTSSELNGLQQQYANVVSLADGTNEVSGKTAECLVRPVRCF